MKRIFLVAALLTGAIGSTQAANNLVVNGSFELGSFGIGSFQGWQTALGDATTFVDSSGQTGPLYGQASDACGRRTSGRCRRQAGATISQALATVAGQAYELSFDLASDNAGAAPLNEFVASIDGAKVYDGVNLADQAYVHERVSFVATGSGDHAHARRLQRRVVP